MIGVPEPNAVGLARRSRQVAALGRYLLFKHCENCIEINAHEGGKT
jgi:hypothetical protein